MSTSSSSKYTFTTFRGSSDGSIKRASVSKPELQDDQVYLEITASGLCGTDLHYLKKDMALGHEGVGIVKATGPAVKSLKEGDRVGWGYIHDTCGLCPQCQSGRETFCAQKKQYGTANLDQGSISTGGIWKESFLFRLPSSISDSDAAPLMCGGATVFTALNMYDVRSTDHVGVVGIGGLGHLAIQFAAKMGCRVTVFSGTDSKKDEALKLGATNFVATKDQSSLDIGEHKINALLVTASVIPDWKLYYDVLAPEAVIFPLSVGAGDLKVPYMMTIAKGLRIQGSLVAPRYIHRRMLEFAALHGIKPVVQKYEMSVEGVEKAVKDLDEGRMRYRGVLVPETETKEKA